MKIGVFAYNFPHQKTQEGLVQLCLSGYKPECVFANDWVDLKFHPPAVRTDLKDIEWIHPRVVARGFDIPYHKVEHNSPECIDLIKKNELDVGVILGARILSQPVIEAFQIGILNLHPGLLPENAGLDTIKWAIHQGLPQGVTCHMIDEHVDSGKLVHLQGIKLYHDDTLLDIHLRLLHTEYVALKESLDSVARVGAEFPEIGRTHPHGQFPREWEHALLEQFEEYKMRQCGETPRQYHICPYCGERRMYCRYKERNYKCESCGHVDFQYEEYSDEGP